ncbi:MAG TPA: hypothetical protein PKJ98_04610 [Verrucomicrobiota bacterium]|nr:hypothetical protein [Verrucomicrobiota bacterium]
MNMDFWTLVACLREQKESLAGWKQFLGAGFDAVRPMLRLCPGEYCRMYPDPQGGCMTQVGGYKGRWWLNFDPDAGYYDRHVELTEADVQLYRLDGDAFRERVRAALGILGPSSSVGPRIECLGNCSQGPKRRRVYHCHARNEAEAMAGAMDVIGRAGADGCALLPKLSENVDRMLATVGVSGVDLASGLVPDAEAIRGGCGIVCRHLRERTDGIEPLRREIRNGFEAVSKERIAEAVQERDREQTIEEMADGADRFLAGLQMKLTEKERELFFALIARTETDGKPRFLNYTEIGTRLGITKQAVRKRAEALNQKHPSVADYLKAIRAPEKPRNFSELSPSQRRRAGIEESYGQDGEG